MSRHFTRKDVAGYVMKLQEATGDTIEIQSISVLESPIPLWSVKYDVVIRSATKEYRVPNTAFVTERDSITSTWLQFVIANEIPPDCADTIADEDAAIKAAWSK